LPVGLGAYLDLIIKKPPEIKFFAFYHGGRAMTNGDFCFIHRLIKFIEKSFYIAINKSNEIIYDCLPILKPDWNDFDG